MPQTPLAHPAMAFGTAGQSPSQTPQWSGFVARSTHWLVQQLNPAGQACVGEQPGAQTPANVLQS